MHVLILTSSIKEVQTFNHNYIYISLLLAAYFSFCGNPLSGNKKYIKQDKSDTSLRLILFK